MKKILLMPDSFKGTMSAREICSILEPLCHKYFPNDRIISLPIADGGEGTVSALLSARGGQIKTLRVHGPLGEEVDAEYGILDDDSAVVEMASAAGLPLVRGGKDVMRANTYGVGEIILHLFQKGFHKIYLGLGGSATNDGGAGAAAALGVKFLDAEGKPFVPAGGTLQDIADIDLSSIPPEVQNGSITLLCDINNPLLGPQGASRIFAPQKGANPDQIQELEKNLTHYARLLELATRINVRNFPGAGAAGGMGAGFMALFQAKMKRGIDVLLDAYHFEDLLIEARFVITGEGKIDGQSLSGKAVVGIARRAAKMKIPVFAIVGDIGDGVEALYDEGITGIFSINRIAMPFQETLHRARDDLRASADNILRVLSSIML